MKPKKTLEEVNLNGLYLEPCSGRLDGLRMLAMKKFDHSNYLKFSQNKVKFQVVSKRSFSLNPSVGR